MVKFILSPDTIWRLKNCLEATKRQRNQGSGVAFEKMMELEYLLDKYDGTLEVTISTNRNDLKSCDRLSNESERIEKEKECKHENIETDAYRDSVTVFSRCRDCCFCFTVDENGNKINHIPRPDGGYNKKDCNHRIVWKMIDESLTEYHRCKLCAKNLKVDNNGKWVEYKPVGKSHVIKNQL